MEEREVRDYIDNALGRGYKINAIRGHLVSSGVDSIMVDEIINQLMFNAPSTEELTAPKKEDVYVPSKEEVFKGEKIPQRHLRKEEKKPVKKLVNPKKIRRKKFIINSAMLLVGLALLSAAVWGGWVYWEDFVEKQKQKYVDEAVNTGTFSGDPLREVVIAFENKPSAQGST